MFALLLLCGAFLFGIGDCKNEFDDNVMKGEISSPAGRFPYLVHIFVVSSRTMRYNYICAGAIQSERWVVTSGDCMLTKSGEQVSSRNMYVTTEDEYTKQVNKYFVDYITIHPHYKNSTGENNIAMIRVDRNFAFSENLQPARTAIADSLVYPYDTNCNLVRGPLQKQMPTNIISLRMCSSLHSNKILHFDEQKSMCTYDSHRTHYACGQWPGGALLVCGKEDTMLVGILHYSPKYQGDWPHCDGYTNPEVYTKLSGFSGWIDALIKRYEELKDRALKKQDDTAPEEAASEEEARDEEGSYEERPKFHAAPIQQKIMKLRPTESPKLALTTTVPRTSDDWIEYYRKFPEFLRATTAEPFYVMDLVTPDSDWH